MSNANPPARRTNRRLWTLLAVLILVLLTVGGLVSLVLLSMFDFRSGEAKDSTPPTAWSVQITAAQQEANKIDKDALLYEVTAAPIDSQSKIGTYSEALEVKFRFAQASGKIFTIALNDSAPTSTVKIMEKPYSSGGKGTVLYESIKSKQSPASAFAAAKIGPRETVLATQEDARNHAAQFHMDKAEIIPFMIMTLIDESPNWGVTYWIPTQPSSFFGKFEPPGSGEVPHPLYYEVSSQDGIILKRSYER